MRTQGNSGVDRAARDVVRYWRLIELFSPQQVPKRDEANPQTPVIDWREGRDLPWHSLPPAGPTSGRNPKPRVWQHTIFLGLYPRDAIYERLHRMFPSDPDAYDERKGGVSACAALVIDDAGRVIPDSPVLSSACWGLGQSKDHSLDNPSWLEGFDLAQDQLAVTLTEHLADIKQRNAMEDDPVVSEELLIDIRSLAQRVAGIVGMDELATTGIRIRSNRVLAEKASELSDFDFLNSFYLRDLGTVAGEPWGQALTQYLTPDGAVDLGRRVDVVERPEVVELATVPRRLPLGRWLSEPKHSLATSQQFAVNEVLAAQDSGGEIVGVNGPPGTGKTTMLRDVLAGNIVRRAEALSTLRRADDAFTDVVHEWKAGEYKRKVRQLREELVGFEMVVASSNNAAVENVSDELPRRHEIAQGWGDSADYFADLATEVAARGQRNGHPAEAAWGLVAARLGNSDNRRKFEGAFWFGKGAQTDAHDPSGGVVHGMQQLLKNWAASAERPCWDTARAAFRDQHSLVTELTDQADRALARLRRRPEIDVEVAHVHSREHHLQSQRSQIAHDLSAAAGDDQRARATVEATAAEHQRHALARPGWWENFTSGFRARTVWRGELLRLNDALTSAEDGARRASDHVAAVRDAAASNQVALDETAAQLRRLRAEARQLEERIESDREVYGDCYPDAEWHRETNRRETHAPWQSHELNAARSELFARALELHRAFLANAPTEMRQSLHGAMDVMTGKAPADLDRSARLAAWQSLFVAVPLVSTTFASVGRMLAGVQSGSLGWLFVDEAGQATPQAAVGAIWRFRHTVAVGDPMQLTPVVTTPRRAQHDLALRFGVPDVWAPSVTSVQKLADRVGQFGTTLRNGIEPVWVSSPLRVHRRCDSPMFDISNRIAYDQLMIDGVHRRDEQIEKFADAPPSQWIDAPNPAAGSHLQRAEIQELNRWIRMFVDHGFSASDMIAISPFRDVKRALEHVASQHERMVGGTIHTAQGREADVVFLVLGGDPTKSGAKAWAAETPNLVNVAVSRAKRRLYVIGDRKRWSKHPYFDVLAESLRLNGGMSLRENQPDVAT